MSNRDNQEGRFGQRRRIEDSPDRRFAESLKFPTPLQPDQRTRVRPIVH
jgi:hypothetical protein